MANDWSTKDPVETLYDKLLATINAHDGLTGTAAKVRVRAASIIDFTQTPDFVDPRREKAIGIDFPIIEIVPAESEIDLQGASGECIIDQVFMVTVRTSKLTIGDLLWVRWQLMRALYPLKDGAATGYNWVVRLGLSAGNDTLEEIGARYKKQGWVSVLEIITRIIIPQSDLT